MDVPHDAGGAERLAQSGNGGGALGNNKRRKASLLEKLLDSDIRCEDVWIRM
jgi:hypothetical protein